MRESMNIENLKEFLSSIGATEFLFKKLSDNDNCKQQIYLGGSYDALTELPHGDIYVEQGVKKPTFKASVKLSWLSDNGTLEPAPNAKFILYPKYPEVRLSGFLSNCKSAPSQYLQPKTKEQRTGGQDGRVLILCPIKDEVIAYLAIPGSSLSNYFIEKECSSFLGKEYIVKEIDTKKTLINVLRKTYLSNPHELVRLLPNGELIPYTKRNAAGYTLEAKFGIIPNGSPEPDFMGWELKCVKENRVTLMTPQPDGGVYQRIGNKEFVLKYGHSSQDGGMYFTGPYTTIPDKDTGRRLIVEGFERANDKGTSRIVDSEGSISLIEGDEILASWSFSHILSHWCNKHNKACYVKYKYEADYFSNKKMIGFLNKVKLCEGTSPIKLIEAVYDSSVYLDPGSRVKENGESKARNQFRITLDKLDRLYYSLEDVDLNEILEES